MTRQQFHEATTVDRKMGIVAQKIKAIEKAHTIVFENGQETIRIVSGEVAFSEIKTTAIAKLIEVQKLYEEEFKNI